VLAGDVYSVAPHVGRGGWSWYTGSAGWMYRLLIESLLGIQLENGNQLRLSPCLPEDWDHVMIDYRFGETLYQIEITQGSEKSCIMLDDKPLDSNIISLIDDRQLHHIFVLSHS
jgi:cellobiose phosphorylase